MKNTFILCYVAAVVVRPCWSFLGPTRLAAFYSYGHFTAMKSGALKTLDLETSPLPKKDEGSLLTDVVICGGGPAGLLSAIMLAQKFPDQKIKVYDRLPAPPSPTDSDVWQDFSRFYLIGLGGRGQVSLSKFGVWKEVEDACTAVVGRKDWAPGSVDAVERIFEGRKFKTQVLPRDKLVSVLYKHLTDNFSKQVELNYGYEVRPIDFGDSDSESAIVEVFQCRGESMNNLDCDIESVTRVSAALVIAADGTSRTLANDIEKYDQEARKHLNPMKRLFAGRPFKVTRYRDDNQRVYKTIPLKLPPGWRADLNYSARSQGGRVNIDALPANGNGEYCGVLLLRKDDELAQVDVDPKKLRAELDNLLPMFSKIMDDDVVAQVAKKPPSFLPAFRFVGPRLHQGKHTVILGDCAHTVKPYFGLGANSALEDVKILSDCIDDTDDMKDAIREFSKRRSRDSKRLVKISRDLDRPGRLGMITFIIPIILDSIFHKMAPRIFGPNVITMLQRDDMTFEQVARRKRIDRFLQLVIVGGGLTAFAAAVRFTIHFLAKAVERQSSTVAATVVASILCMGFLKRALKFAVPGTAPADVLALSKTKITDKESITNSNNQ